MSLEGQLIPLQAEYLQMQIEARIKIASRNVGKAISRAYRMYFYHAHETPQALPAVARTVDELLVRPGSVDEERTTQFVRTGLLTGFMLGLAMMRDNEQSLYKREALVTLERTKKLEAPLTQVVIRHGEPLVPRIKPHVSPELDKHAQEMTFEGAYDTFQCGLAYATNVARTVLEARGIVQAARTDRDIYEEIDRSADHIGFLGDYELTTEDFGLGEL